MPCWEKWAPWGQEWAGMGCSFPLILLLLFPITNCCHIEDRTVQAHTEI